MLGKHPPGYAADPHEDFQETHTPYVASAPRGAAFLGVSPGVPDGNLSRPNVESRRHLATEGRRPMTSRPPTLPLTS